MRRINKLLVALLCMALVLSFFPATALAEDGEIAPPQADEAEEGTIAPAEEHPEEPEAALPAAEPAPEEELGTPETPAEAPLRDLGADSITETSGNWTYSLDSEGNATITDYLGASVSVTIPSELDGHPVVGIGDEVFQGDTGMTSVSIPNSVIRIGNRAFAGSGLSSLQLPANLQHLGYSVLNGTNGVTELTIPKSLGSTSAIWSNGYRYCPLSGSNVKTLSFESGTTRIWDSIAGNDKKLRTVNIPSTVTAIGPYAFQGCDGLASISLPSGLTSIEDYAFNGCTALTGISLPDSVTWIGDYAFSYSGLTSLHLPSGLTGLGYCFLNQAEGVTELTIPKSLQSAHSGYSNGYHLCALAGSYVETLTIEAGTTRVWDTIACNAEHLETVILPSTVTAIGNDAFQGCSALESINLPSGLTSIGDLAFNGTAALTSISIPDTVTWIGNDAFSYSGLTSLRLPSGLTGLGWCFLNGTEGVKELTIPRSLQTVSSGYSNGYHECALAGSYVETLTIEAGPTRVWDTIAGNAKHLKTVNLPSTVTAIGNDAFQGCSALESINLPSGLTSIGDLAFNGTTALTSISIPDSVTWIGNDAFSYSGLTSLRLPSGLTGLGWCFLNATEGVTELTIPQSLQTASSGYSNGYHECVLAGSYVETLRFEAGTTKVHNTIAGNAKHLKTVVLPSTVTGIGTEAFQGCSALESINLPSGFGYIEDRAFSNCSSLTSITIPDTATWIGTEAFAYSGLTSLRLPAGLTGMGYGILYYNEGVKELTIPKSLESAGTTYINGYFLGPLTSSAVETLILEAGSTKVHKGLAGTDTNLKSVVLPDSVTSIEERAFLSCSAITDITFPANLTSIGLYAFSGCTALKTIRFLGSAPTSISGQAFYNVNSPVFYPDDRAWDSSVMQDYSGTLTWLPYVLVNITAQPRDQMAALNGTAVFSVTARGENLRYQWQWSNDGKTWRDSSSSTVGYNTATLQVTATQARSGYQYRCQVTDDYMTFTSDAATLTVVSKPAVTTQPKSVTVNEGSTAKFTVAASGGGLSYQWQWRSGSSGTWANSSQTGNKTATLSIPATAARNGQQYRCKVSNAAGTVYTGAATLTVKSKPVITAQPKSVSVTEGTTARFTVTASGSGLSYQWQWRSGSSGTWANSSRDGNQTATLSVPATLARSGQQYRCVVSNSVGTVYSSAATLTVTVGKPTVTTQPKSVTVAEGATARFTVAASGSGLSYQWQWRSGSSGTWANSSRDGNKTATLSVPATAARSGQQYRCVITNSAGTAYSSAATLTVRTKPVISTQPKSVSVEEGATASFTVAASGGGLSYQWQWRSGSSGTWADSSRDGNKTATLSVPATAARSGQQYRCKVTNIAGTTYSSAATLTVTPAKPSITTQPANVTASEGEAAMFRVVASGTGLSYQWQYRSSSSGSWANCTSGVGCKSATLYVDVYSYRNGYQYRCAVTNSAGTVYSSAATLTVN